MGILRDIDIVAAALKANDNDDSLPKMEYRAFENVPNFYEREAGFIVSAIKKLGWKVVPNYEE